MQHFVQIITQPDNIPIVGMLFLLILVTGVALREAILNDRLIKQGKKDRIADRME